jgi:nucleoside-diphosphate kinase
MSSERTLLIIKHDGVARGLMGEIIKRVERTGLKLIALEFLNSTQDLGENHYPRSEKWLSKVGNRTLGDYQNKGLDAKEILGTNDPIEIGRMVKKWLVDYLSVGPVLAMIWEGPQSVKIVRKIAGDTIPANALPGTIRGDFGFDDPELANKHNRPIYNLVHASGEVAEANEEIALWFTGKEVHNYKDYSDDFTGLLGKMH